MRNLKILRRALRYGLAWLPGNCLRCAVLRAIGGTRLGRDVCVGRNVRVGDDVVIQSGSTIEGNVVLRHGIHIGEKCTIGSHAILGEGTRLGDNVIIGRYARIGNAVIGNGSHVETNVVFTGFQKGRIRIGQHTYIGIGAVIDWSGGIEIGDHVHIAGPSAGLWTHSSIYQALNGDALSEHDRKVVEPVYVENNVWIGGNCTIYPGVRLNHHSAVLPNSAVSESVQSWTVVGGCPAKPVRSIRSESDGISLVRLNIEKPA